MPLETAQILCTVAIQRGFTAPYKQTHKFHPAVKWAAKSVHNWMWLCEHGLSISKNYTITYGKIHKCEAIIRNMMNKTEIIWEINGDSSKHTPFVLCMPDIYKVADPVQSYRNYYKADKAYIGKWSKREVPTWW
jgi:hypothetical protein